MEETINYILNNLDVIIAAIFGAGGIGTAIKTILNRIEFTKNIVAFLSNTSNVNEPTNDVKTVLAQDDSIYKMIDDDKLIIRNLCVAGEWVGVIQTIEANEKAMVYRYILDLEKASVLVELGFITITLKQPISSNIATYKVITDYNGDRIGDVNIVGIFETTKSTTPLKKISKSSVLKQNKLFVKCDWVNAGVEQVGIKVGNEPIQWKGVSATSGDEFNTRQSVKFKFVNYPEQTLVVGEDVLITVYKGYETAGENVGLSTKESAIKITSEMSYIIPVVE